MKNANYLELTDSKKEEIIKYYYENPHIEKRESAENLGVSRRAYARVLKESGINTKRKNRYKFNENYFENIDTKEKAYILGIIASDGFIGNGRSNQIVFQSIDLELIEFIKKELQFTGEIKPAKKSGGFGSNKTSYRLQLSSSKTHSDLIALGIYSRKSLSYSEFPPIQESLLGYFVRGYIDGDGSIISSTKTCYGRKNGKTYYCPYCALNIIGTKEMMQKIANFLELENYNISDSKTPQMKYLRSTGLKNSIKIFLKCHYLENFGLTRKRNKMISYLSAIELGNSMKKRREMRGILDEATILSIVSDYCVAKEKSGDIVRSCCRETIRNQATETV